MELHQNSISNDTGLIFTAREASNLPWVNFIVSCTKCCNFSDKIFVYNFTFNQPTYVLTDQKRYKLQHIYKKHVKFTGKFQANYNKHVSDTTYDSRPTFLNSCNTQII